MDVDYVNEAKQILAKVEEFKRQTLPGELDAIKMFVVANLVRIFQKFPKVKVAGIYVGEADGCMTLNSTRITWDEDYDSCSEDCFAINEVDFENDIPSGFDDEEIDCMREKVCSIGKNLWESLESFPLEWGVLLQWINKVSLKYDVESGSCWLFVERENLKKSLQIFCSNSDFSGNAVNDDGIFTNKDWEGYWSGFYPEEPEETDDD